MKKKVLFTAFAILMLTSVLIYAYGYVKRLTVTDYGGDTTSTGRTYQVGQPGYCFVSTIVNDSQGGQVQVSINGMGMDGHPIQYEQGGPYQIQVGYMNTGDYVNIIVLTKTTNDSTKYTTSELWQWQN